ncbi:unnamed protein product [Rotaria sordida]|uniref:Uncharacterized protein n=1 Tax=Rotaria sordida TaxID=392033 RepID=A0A813R643_9BILA|nr:unnamed protein product [Rotaria sordida]CAF0777574.1 unnamed protein product [Rotaria sordida]CAF0786325.1 unnamed protein product [Rotaria sordida]CAF0787452.1 unnamed protein product [Rotaria sordida]CAF3575759.1 unnamed protein product [Rotaria sordida]
MMNKKSTIFRKTSFSSRSSLELTPMIYLCRFHQRNRLIEIPITSEYYHQQNGISHEHLKYLIIQEFQLQQITKTTLIIQMWNEQYQEYIDIESFKRIPFEGRLQVLIEKDMNTTGDLTTLISKSPSTPVSSHTITTTARSITPIPLQTISDVTTNRHAHNLLDESDSSSQLNIKIERIFDESVNTISPIHQIDNLPHSQHNLMYDLLPKPNDGIPIPRFPPHIAAFLNGNGDANQLNALVQALYQEIVKYELYPNADELRSIVSRLVDRYPHCVSVIGSIELLVRKLYYKFCNERKKYPIELKRRQPNKRKRLIRDDDLTMMNNQQIFLGCQTNISNELQHSSLNRLMNLWTTTTTTTNDYKNLNQQRSSRSSSSSNSSSPISNNLEQIDESQKYHPINLSISTNNNNLMCTE